MRADSWNRYTRYIPLQSESSRCCRCGLILSGICSSSAHVSSRDSCHDIDGGLSRTRCGVARFLPRGDLVEDYPGAAGQGISGAWGMERRLCRTYPAALSHHRAVLYVGSMAASRRLEQAGECRSIDV